MYHASRPAEMRFLNPAEQWLSLHILRVAREGYNFLIYPRTTVEFPASGNRENVPLESEFDSREGLKIVFGYVQIMYTKKVGTKAYWGN